MIKQIHRIDKKIIIFFPFLLFLTKKSVTLQKKKEHNEKEIGIHSNDFQACR